MSQFFENLWNSIFTPGPTPTLLVATNASFAALQITLFGLLVATYSIHFVILSFLCGGLWWAINWFANELRLANEKEEAAKRIRERRGKESGRSKDGESSVATKVSAAEGREGGEGEGMDTGDDTETETEDLKKSIHSSASADASPAQTNIASAGAGTTTGAQPSLAPTSDDALTRRKASAEGAESSTDSEWEKVEEEGEGYGRLGGIKRVG
ncbi:uncharacterized protein K452DRAFT_356810 [Aplosporella prunicola CBS 121167]|uniref:Pkr1-domain-containing protein n=1 Tax=Aplosporella prunicola CBS 121167 TaxID=1176127 RepID=A0A6A6BQ28_9PEZI|nr:uncharacterized protein K452DRAFT_356810 [Aplosporella prunicola CBS 121167]KAF2144681.1 hypothetical protein K452DRAFT_356810 [Aplosporella prunicola CBS 121167]